MADDLREMNYMTIYNIVAYYLQNQFSFTKAIISPKGSAVEFTVCLRVLRLNRILLHWPT